MIMHKSFIKGFVISMLILFGLSSTFASQNIVDVEIAEYVYEHVKYNPLQATLGSYVDEGENRTIYSMNGTIIIYNNHNDEPVNDVVLNITGTTNIYNLNNSAGALAYISTVGTDSVILVIPDLAAGANATFTYDVNTTNVAPPINFTSGYSDSRIFAGLPITVTDTIQNTLNATDYPNNCLYDINITQNAMTINVSGVLYNVTFDGTSMAGTDAGNAPITADNLTINWDALGGACLNSTNSTDIFYDVFTPAGINTAADYEIINTTIKYSYNGTFSRISVSQIDTLLDLDQVFDKYLVTVLTGDNATWRVNGSVINPTNITVNLTTVSFWVSVRDSSGTGFTNPGRIENDTISGAQLLQTYNANTLLNNSLSPWSSAGSEWFFNSTYVSSPIVWMDIDNFIVDDGIQLTNRSISYGEDSIYIKELYIATGYWLQISRNITRLADNSYNVFIKVVNLGTSPTPKDKVVQVYNFLPNTFSLDSPFVYSSASTWYTSVQANETLNDPIYNGTMYQFGIIANGNPSNSSLDSWSGIETLNNTWTLTYNVTGSGEFNFDDLFLTGVDPLNVESYGATQAVTINGIYGFVTSKVEIIFGAAAAILGILVLFF